MIAQKMMNLNFIQMFTTPSYPLYLSVRKCAKAKSSAACQPNTLKHAAKWYHSVTILLVVTLICANLALHAGSVPAPAQKLAKENVSANAVKTLSNNQIGPFVISIEGRLHDFMISQLSGLDDATVSIQRPDGTTISGAATLLLTQTFDLAGAHVLSFTRVHYPNTPHDASGHVCDHYSLPEQITVIVNPHRIEYLTGSMTFSEPIVGGQPTEHITVSIQVVVTGEDVAVPTQFTSSGIQTTITGQLNPQQATLSAGTHTLQYTLQGMGKPGTYIQLNFKDANGHEVPCGITTPL
jgi:hypothetical protein